MGGGGKNRRVLRGSDTEIAQVRRRFARFAHEFLFTSSSSDRGRRPVAHRMRQRYLLRQQQEQHEQR
jgi:hypothetical protein